MSENSEVKYFIVLLLVGGWMVITIGLSMWNLILGMIFLGAGMVIMAIIIAANEDLKKGGPHV